MKKIESLFKIKDNNILVVSYIKEFVVVEIILLVKPSETQQQV